MAHGVKTPTIILQQALHGYADGHRLLASSALLKPQDAKIVATLSDASGSTANLEDTGYLTGYPLPDAGLYALAKTWPAPEMPRPGCVWTHTLFVDFADLAAIQYLGCLAKVFVRPQDGKGPGKRYSAEISLGADALSEPAVRRTGASADVLRQLLWALYGRPQERIFSTAGEPEERESITLALWSQQWPRLRRSFRFCTLVSSDRSSYGAPFDLQFGSRDARSPRGRQGKLFDADHEPVEEGASWLEGGLQDLVHAGELRSFLRALGAELEGGRELFKPLAELYEVLYTDSANTVAIRKGAVLLDGPLSNAEARDARTQLLRRLAETDGDLDENLVAFSIRNLPLISDDDLRRIAPRVGATQWRQAPRELVRMLTASGREHTLAKHAIAALPTRAILTQIAETPDLATSLLQERPDLLSEPDLWAAQVLQEVVVDAVRAAGVPKASVIDAAIDAAVGSLVQPLSEQWGSDMVVGALLGRLERRHADRSTDSEARWFSAAATPNAVAAHLSRGDRWLLTTLCALAHVVQPDDLPNDYGEDPVFTALRHGYGELSPTSSLFLRSWVLARALGYRSRNQADLLSFSFEGVYLAARGGQLPDEAWRMLDGRLPNSFWGDWGRDRRLRTGLLRAFVGQDLDAGIFGRLLPSSEDLFNELISETSWMWGGREYLRRVKRALKDMDSHQYEARIATLNQIV